MQAKLLLALLLCAVPAAIGELGDVRLDGSYEGHAFGPEYGWVFVRVSFSDCGRNRMAVRIAYSQAHYNFTCEQEEYALRRVTESASSGAGDAALEVDLPNVAHRRGCVYHRVKEDNDYDHLAISALVSEHDLDRAEVGTSDFSRRVAAKSLEAKLFGLGHGAPEPVLIDLVPASDVARSEDSLAQHFPPHRQRGSSGLRPAANVDEL
jgi:hypothetical protein